MVSEHFDPRQQMVWSDWAGWYVPRKPPKFLPALAADRPSSLSGYGGGPYRCVVKADRPYSLSGYGGGPYRSVGKESLGVIGLGSLARKIPSRFQSGSAELAPALEPHLPRQVPDPSDLRRRLGSSEFALAVSVPAGGGLDRCLKKVPGSIPGKIPKPYSDLEKMTKWVVRYEADAYDPTAVWRIVHLRPSEQPRERKLEIAKSAEDSWQISQKGIQGTQSMSTPEGNFNFPSTDLSVVVTGGEQDQVPNVSVRRMEWENPDEVCVKNDARLEDGMIVSKSEGVEFTIKEDLDCAVLEEFVIPSWLFGLSLPTPGPIQEPTLVKQRPQSSKEYLSQPHYQYQPRQWNPNFSNERVHNFYKSLEPLDWNQQSETNLAVVNNPDEAKFYLAQLYEGKRADKRLRCIGLFWKLPPWPDFCTMNCDSFAQHCGYKWVLGHKCKQNQQVDLMAGDVSDEAKFDLAQLYMGKRVDRGLRSTGLRWNLPPWPGFCALILDRFVQHSDYKVLENSHSVKQYNHIVLDYTVKFEELIKIWPIVNEDYYARVEGREIISNLSKAVGLATMSAAMRLGLDNIDEYVRNTIAWAFRVMAFALDTSALLSLLKTVCQSKKSWQVRHTDIKVVQQTAILMGCTDLSHLKSLVEIFEHGLSDENPKVQTITALVEAVTPYGIESFNTVWKPPWKGIRSHLGKVLAAYLKNEKLSIDEIKLTPLKPFELIASIKNGIIKGKNGKEIVDELTAKGGTVKSMMEGRDWVQIADPAAIEARHKKNNISNMSVIAHVDHGKSTLTQEVAGDVSKTDIRADEAKRGTTIKSTGISLFYEMTEESLKSYKSERDGNKYLINLINSPEHVDFSSEVTATLRVTDGVSLGVDCIEGVCVQTETVLSQALDERIRTDLTVNKMDRCFLEFQVGGEEAYQTFSFVIENANVSMATYDDALLGDVQVYLEKGTVAFSAGLHGRVFTLSNFAKMYASKFGVDESKMLERLGGENFFDPMSKKWTTKNTGSATCKRGFAQFGYEPIKQITKTCMNEIKDSAVAGFQWASEEGALPEENKRDVGFEVYDVVFHVDAINRGDGQVISTARRVTYASQLAAKPRLLEPVYLVEIKTPENTLDDIYATDIRNCDREGSLMLHISKRVPASDKSRLFAFGLVISGKVAIGMKVHSLTMERVTYGSQVGIIHSIDCNGTVHVGLIGLDTFWKGGYSDLQVDEAYCVMQFVRLEVNISKPRFEWQRKSGGGFSTDRISQILPNGCLVVKLTVKFSLGEVCSFLAEPYEVVVVSFGKCEGIMKKYEHLENFHWAVRLLLITMGFLIAMRLGILASVSDQGGDHQQLLQQEVRKQCQCSIASSTSGKYTFLEDFLKYLDCAKPQISHSYAHSGLKLNLKLLFCRNFYSNFSTLNWGTRSTHLRTSVLLRRRQCQNLENTEERSPVYLERIPLRLLSLFHLTVKIVHHLEGRHQTVYISLINVCLLRA